MPQRVIESWLFERKNIVKTAEQMKRPLSKHEEDILVRCLALFHVIVPVLLVWMVYKLRYDRRALAAQTLFCRFVLLVCVWFTDRL